MSCLDPFSLWERAGVRALFRGSPQANRGSSAALAARNTSLTGLRIDRSPALTPTLSQRERGARQVLTGCGISGTL